MKEILWMKVSIWRLIIQNNMKYFNEHKCMMNSYKLLTGKETYDEMLEKDNQPAFIFNPTKPVVTMEDDVFDVLIDYFSDLEEYEICAELRDHKKINSFYSLSAPLVTCKNGMLPFRSDGYRLGKNSSNSPRHHLSNKQRPSPISLSALS